MRDRYVDREIEVGIERKRGKHRETDREKERGIEVRYVEG
jgi:hypothetical protein